MTTIPATDSVQCELAQGWLTVWFNQPERRNPLTDEVVADLQRICDALQDSRDIRGLTLRGRGGFFCAGGDLKGFQTMATASSDTTGSGLYAHVFRNTSSSRSAGGAAARQAPGPSKFHTQRPRKALVSS